MGFPILALIPFPLRFFSALLDSSTFFFFFRKYVCMYLKADRWTDRHSMGWTRPKPECLFASFHASRVHISRKLHSEVVQDLSLCNLRWDTVVQSSFLTAAPNTCPISYPFNCDSSSTCLRLKVELIDQLS